MVARFYFYKNFKEYIFMTTCQLKPFGWVFANGQE